MREGRSWAAFPGTNGPPSYGPQAEHRHTRAESGSWREHPTHCPTHLPAVLAIEGPRVPRRQDARQLRQEPRRRCLPPSDRHP